MRKIALAAVIAFVVIAGATAAVLSAEPRHNTAKAATVATTTATVIRTDLSTTTQAAGTLGYAGSYQIVDQTAGTAITALPAPGTRMNRGDTAFEIDGQAVPLLYGPRPMWRDLKSGITPGADVAQLDENLIALGFSDHGQLVVNDDFTWQTRSAIDAWQLARGLVATGAVHVGDIVYAPGPIRVASLSATVGEAPQPRTVVYQATSPVLAVDVSLPVTQEYLVHVGDAVTVTLPDGTTTTPGFIAAISTAASGAANGAGAGNGPSQGGSNQPATVDVTVGLRDPAATAAFTQAPVTVNITNAQVRNVLAVPINALVALAEGGYGVETVNGTQRRLLAVAPGLFSNTLVQVSGAGLAAGMRVEVPTA
jgi:peptidoglycan hydrolase-like protein with peptidoglycan-binding domain